MSGQSVTAVITGGHRRISPSAAPGAQSVVLVSAASPGVESYAAATSAGLALLDDADAAAQRTTLGVGAGDSPTVVTVVPTGVTNDVLVRKTSAGLVDSCLVENLNGVYVPAAKPLIALVSSNGSAMTAVSTPIIACGGDQTSDSLTANYPYIGSTNNNANDFRNGWEFVTRGTTDVRLKHTLMIPGGGLQLGHCTADPSGVAGTSQIWPRNSDGEWYARVGAGTAFALRSRLINTSTKSARYVAAVNENVICDANAADYDGTATRSGNVLTASGFTPEDLAEFQVSGSVPGGLVAGTRYWMKSVSGSTFEVSATPGGSSITLSGATSGITITGYSVPILFPATIAAGDEWGIELRTAHSVRTIMPHFQGFTVVGYSSHQPLRLIAAGEQLRFRAVDASTVVVTQVKQTKQQTAMSLVSSVSSHYANAVFTKVPLDTTDYDVCGNADLANDAFVVRRSCKLATCGEAYSLGVTSGVGEAQINVGSTGVAAGPLAPGTSLGCVGSVGAAIDVDAGESVTLSFYQNTGSAKEATGTASVNYLHCSEL